MIKDALLELMTNNKFEDITILQITNKGLISRMTFYRYFKTKEDILLFSFKEKLSDITKNLSSTSNPNFRELLIIRFNTLKTTPYINLIFKTEEFNTIISNFKDVYGSASKDMIKTTNLITINFIYGGIKEITFKWIENNMNEDINTMVDNIIKLIEKLIKH